VSEPADAERRATQPGTATTERGWWRRNRWGLVALLPALVAAMGVNLSSAYEMYWKSQPREPVAVGDGGWVAFAGARMRLVDLALADDLKDSYSNPVTPPEGTRVWRARIAFDAPQPEPLAGCELLLEDDAGRTYEATPRDVPRVSLPFPSCKPDTSASKTTATPTPATSAPTSSAPATIAPATVTSYETVAYFITSSAAHPVAVRVILPERLPAYARLPVA